MPLALKAFPVVVVAAVALAAWGFANWMGRHF
jgi:nitrate reductase NapE component